MLLLLVIACKPKTETTEVKGDTTVSADTSSTADVPPPPMDSAAMEKAWETFMTPGPQHEWMAKAAGTWNVEVTAHMGPDVPPEKSTATSVVRMALNKLYQISDYNGTMMGMPFEGHGVLAYDNAKKMFVNTWIDNLGSGIMIMTGQYDEATKTLKLSGHQSDPMTGKDSPVRQDVVFIDDNNQSFTLYGPGMDGKETVYMSAVLKRKS